MVASSCSLNDKTWPKSICTICPCTITTIHYLDAHSSISTRICVLRVVALLKRCMKEGIVDRNENGVSEFSQLTIHHLFMCNLRSVSNS